MPGSFRSCATRPLRWPRLTRPPSRTWWRRLVRPLHVLVSAVPVFLIPLIGYSALYLQPLGDATDSFRAFLTGLITVAGLGLLTLRLAAQGGELERAGARMRLLAAATEQTGDLILITRVERVFEHANDAFVRALGYSRHELAKLTVRDLMAQGFGAVPAQNHARRRVSAGSGVAPSSGAAVMARHSPPHAPSSVFATRQDRLPTTSVSNATPPTN